MQVLLVEFLAHLFHGRACLDGVVEERPVERGVRLLSLQRQFVHLTSDERPSSQRDGPLVVQHERLKAVLVRLVIVAVDGRRFLLGRRSRLRRLARVLSPLALRRQRHPLLGELSFAGVDVVQNHLEGFAGGRRSERLDAHQGRRHAAVVVLERRIGRDHVLPSRPTVRVARGRHRPAAPRARRKWHGCTWIPCKAEGLDSVRLPHFAGTAKGRYDAVFRRALLCVTDGRSLLAGVFLKRRFYCSTVVL